MVDPRRVHLTVAKYVMRYLKGTLDFFLCYSLDNEFRLFGFTDSNWAGSTIDRKCTSRCFFSFGSAMISWISRTQSIISLNTAEAKYIEACIACCEVIWI